jgi:predicted PurR-regulated permease PerM
LRPWSRYVLLREVLLLFVAGMVPAYLLDPLADRFERLGMNRLLATLAIIAFVVAALAILTILTVPVIVRGRGLSWARGLVSGARGLLGQQRAYAEQQMLSFKVGLRHNDINAQMRSVARRIGADRGRTFWWARC